MQEEQQLLLHHSQHSITTMVQELLLLVESGAAAGSIRVERGHWRWWADFCTAHNVDPWRLQASKQTSTCLLLAMALPWIHIRMSPKKNEHKRRGIPAQPQSALNVLLGIRRLHKRLGVTLPPLTLALGAMKGLLRSFVETHGSRYLARQKSLAFSQDTVVALCMFLHQFSGLNVGRRVVSLSPFSRMLKPLGLTP